MDLVLQFHNAKPICDIPDGLRELCADISREVIRYQPRDIYCFVADYLDALLITRENANIAVKVVRNVMMKGQQIAEILAMTGLKLEEIAAVMPRLRNAFREYLDFIEAQKNRCGCDDDSEAAENCERTISCILLEIGAPLQKAECAAIKIQSAFRGHYERIKLTEQRGEISWQRAAVTTVEILRKTGISRNEASHAATVIQSVYRGYYTRRNAKMREERSRQMGIAEPKKQNDLTAWFTALLDDNGLTLARANEAAIIIQIAYRKYRNGKTNDELIRSEISDQKISTKESYAKANLDVKLKGLRFESKIAVSIVDRKNTNYDIDYDRYGEETAEEDEKTMEPMNDDTEEDTEEKRREIVGIVEESRLVEEKNEAEIIDYSRNEEASINEATDRDEVVTESDHNDQVRENETETNPDSQDEKLDSDN